MKTDFRQIDGEVYKPVEFTKIGPGIIDGAALITEVWPQENVPLPPPRVSNTLPYQFSWWGKIFYSTREPFERAAPLQLFASRPGVVIGHDAGLELANGCYYEPMSRYLKAHRPSSLFRQTDGQLWVRSEGAQAAGPGRYFLGFNSERENYAHLLTDTLPLLYIYKRYLFNRFKLVVPALDEAPIYAKLLECLGIDHEHLYVMPNRPVHFDEIYFASQVSLWSATGLLNPAADALLDWASARTGQQVPSTGKRLYLSRGDARSRQLLNEASLLDRLTPLGFEVVYCSALSLEEQISLFRAAEFIIAPHGAALANVLFCTPRASVLELFPEYCVQPEFCRVSALRRVNYGYIVGTSFERENSRVVQSSWDASFVIDEDLVEDAFRRMIEYGPAASSD